MKKLSIIIPVYYGEKTIGSLVNKVHKLLSKKVLSIEVVLVNDGSTDSSDDECRKLVKTYPKDVVYVSLAKNFSEHNAVMAGLNVSTGEFAVIIDDDFQNPPEEILKLFDRIQKTKADVVYSYYKQKKHSWFRNLGSRFNDKVANMVLDKPEDLYLSSFKIIRRNVINEVIKYTGPYPYIDGLILRATQHIDKQLVKHDERQIGKSNYTLKKLLLLWSNMFINFSIKPLRWSLYLGVIFALLGFVLAAGFIFEKLRNPDLPLGWASTTSSLLILSGIQLLILGMMGEFVGRMYLTHNVTPQYVIRDIVRGKENEEK